MNNEIEVRPLPTAQHAQTELYPGEKETTGHAEHGNDIVKERDLRADAIEAENVEHNMTVTQAVKAYPMACFWAFVMSFCIVSRPSPKTPHPVGNYLVVQLKVEMEC